MPWKHLKKYQTPKKKRKTSSESTSSKVERYAREMRYSPTAAEQRLHNALLKVFAPYLTEPLHQFIIGPFIADFKVKNLIIEVDGPTHTGREAYDARRTTFIENRGYRVLRLTNAAVYADAEKEALHIFKLTEPHQLRTSSPIQVTICPPGSAIHGKRGKRDKDPLILNWMRLKS